MTENYEREFTDEEIYEGVSAFEEESVEILQDEKKMEKFIRRVQLWLEKGRRIFIFRNFFDDIITMLDLVVDYSNGTYKRIPVKVLLSIIACLLYIISPFDLVPDWIPVVGFMDDIAVIRFFLKKGVASELEIYRQWKLEKAIDI